MLRSTEVVVSAKYAGRAPPSVKFGDEWIGGCDCDVLVFHWNDE